MQPRLSLVTLGTLDFDRAVKFYRDGLGWSAQIMEDTAFFQLSGIILGIYPREKLAEDAKISPEGNGFSGITLAYNTGSEAEVNEVFEIVKNLGAEIIKMPEKVFWGGYSGYFKDPDGFLWEVAYNPFWKMHEDGRVTLN